MSPPHVRSTSIRQVCPVGYTDPPSMRSARPGIGLNTMCRFLPTARLSRNVGQPDHILANSVMRHEAERWPGSGEIGFAMTEHDRVQVDPILIDQAEFGEAVRQVRPGHFDL